MSKKKEIPGNDPTKLNNQEENIAGQRPDSPTRSDIKKTNTDYVNPNNGPQQRSQKNK